MLSEQVKNVNLGSVKCDSRYRLSPLTDLPCTRKSLIFVHLVALIVNANVSVHIVVLFFFTVKDSLEGGCHIIDW